MLIDLETRMKCTRCKEPAVREMKYSGESLCKACFLDYFESRVKKTLRSSGLSASDMIVVGLSGGKDSVAMLHLLSTMHPKKNLFAITIDGGIADYEDRLIDNCKSVCSSLGIEHSVLSFQDEYGYDVNDLALARPGRCNCGISRRSMLNRAARSRGADWLAIGHNLDDETENILLNYINGNVNKLVSDSSKKRIALLIPRLKPLKMCPEEEVELYASLLYPGLRFDLHCPYRAGVIRNDIKDMIDSLEDKHPGIRFKIFRGAEKIRSLVRTSSQSEMSFCSRCGEPASNEICQACIQSEDVVKKLGRTDFSGR